MFWLAEGLVAALGIVRQCDVQVPLEGNQVGRIRVYVVKRLWAYGFSAGSFILIREDGALATNSPRWQKEMYLEEYYHSLQYLREGAAVFPLKYLFDTVWASLQGKDGYSDNRFEIEAKLWATECYDGKHPDPYEFDVVGWGAGKVKL